MIKNLDLIEESDLWDKMVNPFLNYTGTSLDNKKRLAMDIFHRSAEEILLIDPSGFGFDSIFAGLAEKHIEYFAKHAPLKYKKELMEIFKDQEMITCALKIAKVMDEDEGDGSNKNQDRIRKNMQYLKDNQAAFQS